jgi:hypothetical protein
MTECDLHHFWLSYCKHMRINKIMSKVLLKLVKIRVGYYIRHERRRGRKL